MFRTTNSRLALSIILLLLAITPLRAQINFESHLIQSNFNVATCAWPEDIDGDGDIDIVGTAAEINTVAWWENDGEQEFTYHIITNNFRYARAVQVADIDNDGDMDIVASATAADEITWWENNGEQEFTAHAITRNFVRPTSILVFSPLIV